VSPFDSKQFEVKREDQAIAKWVGPKDDVTLGQLLALFRIEKWKGQFTISYSGNGGVSDVVFTERKQRRLAEDAPELPY